MDRFQSFLASIATLAGDEARKAKLLYLRNELAAYEAQLEHDRSFGLLQLAFAVIPFFWPFLYAQRRSMIASAQLGYRRIQNALDTWGQELGDDAPLLAAQLQQLASQQPRLFPWSKPRRIPQLTSGGS